jgi:hypothetical protein
MLDRLETEEFAMTRKPCLLVLAVLFLLCACASVEAPPKTPNARISVDPATERYSISAKGVSRGDLLDELAQLSGVVVHPQPNRDELLTVEAHDLDIAELVRRLVPDDARSVIRWGDREVSAVLPSAERAKQGPPVKASAGTVAKVESTAEKRAAPAQGHNLKKSPDAAIAAPPSERPGGKPPVTARVAEAGEPKKPKPREVERATVRLTLEFESGAAPRVIAAQSIEGRATPDRFTHGPYLFAVVASDGRLLQFGTFQDPLEEHSYRPDGTHDVRQAKSGVAGISILRENLAGARLLIVDASQLALPRELDEQTVSSALERGKQLLQTELAPILRSLDQGAVK